MQKKKDILYLHINEHFISLEQFDQLKLQYLSVQCHLRTSIDLYSSYV